MGAPGARGTSKQRRLSGWLGYILGLYSSVWMDAYCPRCKVSSKDVDEAVLKAGECPDCGGQIALGGVTTNLPIDGAIAMSFTVGSRIAMPLDASFEQTEIDMNGSVRGTHVGRDDLTQPSTRRPPPPPLDEEVTVDMSSKPGSPPIFSDDAPGGPPPPPADDEPNLDSRVGSAAAGEDKGDLFSSSDTPEDDARGDSKPSDDLRGTGGDAAASGGGSSDGAPPPPSDPGEADLSAHLALSGAHPPAPPTMDVEVTVRDATNVSAPPVDPVATTPAMDLSVPDFGMAPGADAAPSVVIHDDDEATVRDRTPSTGAEESPAAGAGSDAPAELGAHLQLPSIDFSVPDMGVPSSDAQTATGAATSPASASTASPGTDVATSALPAHLQLPSFPDFQLPPIPGREGEQKAGDIEISGAVERGGGSFDAMQQPAGEEPAPVADASPVAGAENWSVASADQATPIPPPVPPPPALPPVKKKTASAAPAPEELPGLPALGLPSFDQQNLNREPTLIETNVAVAMAQQAATKRSFGSILMIGLTVGLGLAVLGGAGFVFVNGIEQTLAMINPPEEKSATAVAREKAEKRFFKGVQAYKDAEQADKDKKPMVAKKGFAAAASHYEKALKHFPKHSQAHLKLGIVYAKLKRQKEAVSHYERYLKLEPKAKGAKKLRKIVDDWKLAQRKKEGTKGKKR